MIDGALQARDEMSAMLAAGWLVADWASLGLASAPAIQWEGRERPVPPDGSLPYAAFFIRHASGLQESLSDHIGQQKWARIGTLMVQCYGSLMAGRGLEDATQIAVAAQRVYQGKSSANYIWFRNATIKEIGPSGGWYQVNMTVAFEYDEVR